MPIDVNLFRTEEGKATVRETLQKRFKDPATVDRIVELDQRWRKLSHEKDQLNAEVNKLSKSFPTAPDKDALKEQIKGVQDRIADVEKRVEEALVERDREVNKVGNIVHGSVPFSKDEKDNVIVATWGKCQQTGNERHHHELMYMIDGFDAPRGVAVAGHRGYFLKGVGVRLNQALINFGLDFLERREYTALQPPFFMNKDIMAETAQLEEFDEALYKVSTGVDGEEKYLIATSEQPISAFHRGEWLDTKTLPYRYCGISSCFRKEAGSHGRDAWGIFRIHQFEKVEQFCITSPEESWIMQEEMIKASQEFYRELGLAYRVVNIVSGELNNAAAKKYDLEAWFPTLGVFRELVSCSNCTDYQARAMETRYGAKKAGDSTKVYAHMLNATLCATERTICCILENYQTESGIVVPKALVPYMGGKTFIPFKNELKREEAKDDKAEKKPKEKKQPKAKEEGPAKKQAAPAPAPAATTGARAPSPSVQAEAKSVRNPSPSVKPGRAPSPAVKPAGGGLPGEDEIRKQGDVVRDLKTKKAAKPEVEAAVKLLLELKAKYPDAAKAIDAANKKK